MSKTLKWFLLTIYSTVYGNHLWYHFLSLFRTGLITLEKKHKGSFNICFLCSYKPHHRQTHKRLWYFHYQKKLKMERAICQAFIQRQWLTLREPKGWDNGDNFTPFPATIWNNCLHNSRQRHPSVSGERDLGQQNRLWFLYGDDRRPGPGTWNWNLCARIFHR